MFEKMFGWNKASTCKKVIKRLQYRLKLLKNKRCSIVKQIQEDVAQLLKKGHHQDAFTRVEQIYKDESIATAYDLLDSFCEFILLQLPYIRKHKDCPNDINEAVSSLVFASARCGDIPELLMIRSLFGERYGQRFTQVALGLLPGNLVNLTIRENLSIKSVPDNVKHYLVKEIARTSCVEPQPLALEYTSEWQQQQLASHSEIQENTGEIVPCYEIYGSSNIHEETQLRASNITEDEEGKKIVCVDIPAEGKNQKEQFSRKLELVDEYMSESSLSDHMPEEEMVYLDDVEEFQSPMNRDGTIQDQSVFVFKPSIVPTSKKFEVNAGSRNMKKRTVSRENRIFDDSECANYYGTSGNQNNKSHDPSENLIKARKSCYAQVDHLSDEMVSCCSLKKTCYLSASDGKDDPQTPPIHQINMFPCSCNEAPINKEGGFLLVPLSMRNKIVFFDDLVPNKQISQLSEESEKVSPQIEKREKKQHYARAMTMPPERPKDNQNDNLVRSNTFPLEQNASSKSPFVHPKLPDYDDLAAKFMALKKEVLQKKQQESRQ